MTRQRYNAVVVGGGAAGLSAALVLGRARRSVLVVDACEPRDAPAGHVRGDGLPRAGLLRTCRDGVRRYGVDVHHGEARAVSGDVEGGFTVEIDGRPPVRTRRVLLAGGVRDELPGIPGLRQRWGRDVLHCPHRHGWEVRDQEVAVLSVGPPSAQQALVFRQWTPHLTFLAHTRPRPTGEEAGQLAARDVSVVPGEVTGLEVRDDRLVGVRLRGDLVLPVAALVVSPRFRPRLPATAVAPVPHPSGMGTHVAVDAAGHTGVPGMWAAGTITDPALPALGAAAAGAAAARAINADLVAEDTRLAVRGAARTA